MLPSHVPPVADQVTPLVAPPVIEAENVVTDNTVRVGAPGRTTPAETACGVTVTALVATVPAAFRTVNV